MKVKIDKYCNWFGPYHISEWFRHVGFSEETRDKIGNYLSESKVSNFLQWIHDRKRRTVKVHIDEYDTWNMDSTLAHIIHPMLVQLKETKHGSPHVDDEDVPENIRSTFAKPKENEWDSDEFLHERWDWVLDEMIWAFKNINEEWEEEFHTPPEGKWSVENFGTIDIEGRQKVQDRMTNGFRLFGKYYQGLWD